MNATEIQQQARKLYDALGSKALVEAARKAQQLEEAGDREQAACSKQCGGRGRAEGSCAES